MTLELSAPPIQSDLVEERKTAFGTQRRISRIWENYFRSRDERLQSAAHTDASVSLPGQTATIAATAIVVAANASTYRISATLSQTAAAGVSSSAQITIRWTYNGVARSRVGTLVNGNTTASGDQMPSFLVHVDAGTNITYEMSYASNPAATAAFTLDVNAEAMG